MSFTCVFLTLARAEPSELTQLVVCVGLRSYKELCSTALKLRRSKKSQFPLDMQRFRSRIPPIEVVRSGKLWINSYLCGSKWFEMVLSANTRCNRVAAAIRGH